VNDRAGKTTKRGYDKDSLVTSTTDAENNTTTVTYDERGKQTEVKVPHEGTSTITYRSTQYEYDQVGNTTKVITPRGTQTANTEDFASRTEYDELNRPKQQYQPYDPADGRYNKANVYTETTRPGPPGLDATADAAEGRWDPVRRPGQIAPPRRHRGRRERRRRSSG
jgi:YD repeat-containing protein